MANLESIKDTSPNPSLIHHLEIMLDYAKKGTLRSLIGVASWDDNSVSHSYYYDKRCYRRMMLAELMMTQQDLATQIGLEEEDSILAKELRGEG